MGQSVDRLGEVRGLRSLRRGPAAMLGFGALGSGFCGALVESSAWAGTAGCVAGLGLGWTWPRLMLAGVNATLRFDRDRCHEGERLGAMLTVVNRSILPAAGLEISGLPGMTLSTLRVPAWGTHEVRIELKPAARGKLWGEPEAMPRVWSSYPLGVSHATIPIAVEGEVLVWPGVVGVEVPDVAGEGSPTDRESRTGRRSGTSGETTGVRQYRRGDAARDVHWRQTARAGELMVRERQSTSAPQTTVVLDVDQRAYADTAPFESAVRMTAAVIDTLSRRGNRLTLHLGGSAAMNPGARRDAARAALDSLALIATGRTPLHEALRATQGERAERLVVTTRVGRDTLSSADRSGTRFLLADGPGGRGE